MQSSSRKVLVSKLLVNRMLLTKLLQHQTFIHRPTALLSFFSSASTRDDDIMEDNAMTQGVDTEGETGDIKLKDDDKKIIPTNEDDHYVHRKTAQVPSASKLQTPGVNTPFDPHVHQKRTNKNSSTDSRKYSKLEEELTCSGLDGSPWPPDDYDKSSRKEKEEDDKEYFKHHKASPLSEIEMGDSSKPVAIVMDGTAGGGYFADEKVVTWTPEQLDTAEQSLRRATDMFREAAARGVPEWPHSRRLRQLLGHEC